MRHERATEEIRELAALFALGSLNQQEARSFEAHMREGCSVCESEFHKFERVVAGIGFAAGEAAVPDYVRDLLLARIEREGQAAAPAAEPTKEVTAKPQTPPVRPFLSQQAQERPSNFPWFLSVILAILAILSFYFYWAARTANRQLGITISEAQEDLKNLRLLLDIQKTRAEELERMFSIASKPDARILHLAGLASAPSISGAILWDTHQNQCLIFGYLPLPPEGKAYQLWFLTPTEKKPAGLLKPNPIGRFYTLTSVPSDISNPALAVTLEPDNGSKIPTMPYVAVGRSD